MNDRELTRAAQNGDVGALGVLVERHKAGMRAVALSLLGPGPDADDAVQDAMVTAIRSIGDVRDPGAVGSWLRSIVRNNCRMQLRAKRLYPVADPESFLPVDDAPSAEELLERTVLRDWVWHAMEALSEKDRLITMVRHFSRRGRTSRSQLCAASPSGRCAAVCITPTASSRPRCARRPI